MFGVGDHRTSTVCKETRG